MLHRPDPLDERAVIRSELNIAAWPEPAQFQPSLPVPKWDTLESLSSLAARIPECVQDFRESFETP